MPRSTSLLPRPAKGEVRVRVAALGMSTLGLQAVGLVEAVGPVAADDHRGDGRVWRHSLAREQYDRVTVFCVEKQLFSYHALVPVAICRVPVISNIILTNFPLRTTNIEFAFSFDFYVFTLFVLRSYLFYFITFFVDSSLPKISQIIHK